MATIRSGSQPVLIVVDVQVGVVADAWQADRVVANVVRCVERARAQQVPVLWVQHGDDELVVGSPAWQWVSALVPAEGEPRVQKQHNSAFEQTGLEALLAGLGATHIVLAGAATNWCIRATAYGALERGYDLTLVSDAHTTKTRELENGTKLEAPILVQDLNIAMTWLSYPERKNDTMKAKDVVFGTKG
jgi:nicotinamidase-related amidase